MLIAIPPYVILVAILPLAAYLTLFGGLRWFGRPIVTTGTRDIIAISIAVSGLIFVGPIDLFFPESTASLIGYRIWFVLAFLYSLIVLLVVISSRQRLVVYGMTPDMLLPTLLTAVKSMDAAARIDEDAGTVTLPTIGIHLRVDQHRGTDISEIFAFETSLLPRFWQHLRESLLSEITKDPNQGMRGGALSLLTGTFLLVCLFYTAITSHEQVMQGLYSWIYR